MAPSYKLSYFRLRARAEPARLIFAYAGVDYEDLRIDWLNKEQKWTPVKNTKSVGLDSRHNSHPPLLLLTDSVLCQKILAFVKHGLRIVIKSTITFSTPKRSRYRLF